MNIIIYANVIKDTKDRIQFPYGIAEFRSFLNRRFITADQPYRHDNAKAVAQDIMIWAFKDEKDCWYLLGDGFVSYKHGSKQNGWEYRIAAARLYPRSVSIDDLSFAKKAMKALYVGFNLTWKQYQELLEKASEPILA